MKISQNDTLLNNSKMKKYNIGKIKDIKFKTEMLYSLMPERMHITKNRINAGEVVRTTTSYTLLMRI